MRHVRNFEIKKGQNQEDLCNQINQYASDNNLTVFNIAMHHLRCARVIFEHNTQACEAPDDPTKIEQPKEPGQAITISLEVIKEAHIGAIDSISLTVDHCGKTYTSYGDTKSEAMVSLITNIQDETGCRVLVNCGSNGKQDASYFMKIHDKLVAGRSKY